MYALSTLWLPWEGICSHVLDTGRMRAYVRGDAQLQGGPIAILQPEQVRALVGVLLDCHCLVARWLPLTSTPTHVHP